MKKKETSYIIQEYNHETQEYITVGHASGTTADAARLKFIQETNWRTRRNITLWAKPPVCR